MAKDSSALDVRTELDSTQKDTSNSEKIISLIVTNRNTISKYEVLSTTTNNVAEQLANYQRLNAPMPNDATPLTAGYIDDEGYLLPVDHPAGSGRTNGDGNCMQLELQTNFDYENNEQYLAASAYDNNGQLNGDYDNKLHQQPLTDCSHSVNSTSFDNNWAARSHEVSVMY